LDKIKTTVTVAGKEYTIVSEDPVEYIKRVGTYVDRKLQEIEHASKLPSYMAAVLTAINITDELLKAQDENAKLRKELIRYQKSSVKKVT